MRHNLSEARRLSAKETAQIIRKAISKGIPARQVLCPHRYEGHELRHHTHSVDGRPDGQDGRGDRQQV